MGGDACAEKFSHLSWRGENRFFEMPDGVVVVVIVAIVRDRR
jgi:hypothetical protein